MGADHGETAAQDADHLHRLSRQHPRRTTNRYLTQIVTGEPDDRESHHVRFGGGPLEKALHHKDLASGLPDPKAACWLNLAEGWWRLLRRQAYAGQSFVDTTEIAYAVETATAQLNTRAGPWIWGRPAPPTRKLRRKFVYRLTCVGAPGQVLHVVSFRLVPGR